MKDELTREDRLMLGRLQTTDDAGRHFTHLYPLDWLRRMEVLGYIDRPCHPTGMRYGSEYWSVSVSPEVAKWFDDEGELNV